MSIGYLKYFWSGGWLELQTASVISPSTNDLIATDCHVLIELRTTAPPWHTCSQRYAQMIWAPVAVTALTETLKQCLLSFAGASASGVMSGGTLVSRDWVIQSALALMDLKDIHRQCARAQALWAWGKAVKCDGAHAQCSMRVEYAKHAQMDQE